MNDIIKYKDCILKENSLEITKNISYDRWLAIGESLSRIEKSSPWWIGDWACQGEKIGDKQIYTDPQVYAEIEEKTSYSRGTIQKYKMISTIFESWNRFQDLTFKH